MNLGDLQSARSKERQKDSLQHLPEDFYANVGAFVEELRTERERAAETADDPFDAPEVRRLTDDIKTTENTVEAVYERRVGKLVKLASLNAAGMPADEDGLTNEERDLFHTLVEAIESNRAHVLDDVLTGGNETTQDSTDAVSEASANSTSDALEPTDATAGTDETNEQGSPRETESVSAADVMGADTSDASADESAGGESPTDESPTDESPTDESPTDESPTDESPMDESPTDEPPAAADRTPAGAADVGGETPENDTDRTTVRITRDIGEIFGVDERTYHLAAEDVVTLPEVNATPLLERDAAEQLE